MDIKTSSKVSDSDISSVEKILRQVAVDKRTDRFFGKTAKIKVLHDAAAPSLEKLAASAKSPPVGKHDLCDDLYAAAKVACKGNTLCLIAAAVAYQECEGGDGGE